MKQASILGLALLAVEAALCLAQDDGHYHSTLMCRPAVATIYEDDGQYHATAPVIASPPNVDDRHEVWLFTADGRWCTWCNKAKEEIEPVWDELPFRIVYKTEIPEWLDGYVETLPTAYWVVGKGKGKTLAGWHGIKSLKSAWSATMPKQNVPKAETPKPKATAVFGPSWYVEGRNTPVSHLTHDHHVPHSVVDPYRNNPVALNRIHGAVHTGMVRY